MLNWNRKMKITIGDATFTNDELEVRFEVEFDDDPKPNGHKITLYNLSKHTLAQFKQGDTAIIQAGYGDDIGILSKGKVDKVLTKTDGMNKITSVYVIEGDDFTKVKVSVENADKSSIKYYKDGPKKGQVIEDALSIGFKANARSSIMIKRLVYVLGIKLAHPPILLRDKVYPKGYVVTKLIMNDLETLVKNCGSAIYHRRGQLVIRPITQGMDENFVLSEETGMIGSPAPFEENGLKGYTVKCLLQHRITTASIITIKSKTANGKFRAMKGKHIADTDDFYTEFQVV